MTAGTTATRKSLGSTKEGPSRLVQTRGASTTLAVSTFSTILAGQYLRRGGGVLALPDCRRTQRLFGVGRTKLSTSSLWAPGYDPCSDTCVRAFVKVMVGLGRE